MSSACRSRPAVDDSSASRSAPVTWRGRFPRCTWRTTVVAGLVVATSLALQPALAAGEANPGSEGAEGSEAVEVPREARAEADEEGAAGVIVQLRSAGSAPSSDPGLVSRRGAQLLDELDELDEGNDQDEDPFSAAAANEDDPVLEHLGVVALEATPEQLDELSRSRLVERIEPDSWLAPALDRSAERVGAPAAWAAGYTGAGSVVAVIDSGIDASHPALAGRVVQEACFSDRSCPGGLSSAAGPGAAAPCSIGLPCQHGTHVAGIVAGDDPTYRGIAPDADIMALQVFSRSDDPSECGAAVLPCPRARTSDVLAALDYVYAQRATLPIVAVNMSLSSDSPSSSCDTGILATAVNRLKSVGVATVVATGNAGATTGLGLPACISSTVSVAATFADRDEVWAGSNVSPDLDLVAPGVGIMSPAPGGSFSPTTGTSAAAPHVAGAWALAAQRLGTSDVDTILGFLKANGRPVSYQGLTTIRLDLNALAGGLPTASEGFEAVTTTDVPCTSCLGVSGDYDDDGRDDLFWHEQDGVSRLWTALGDGTYREDLAIAIGPTRFVPVAGDFDGDGPTDLLWYPLQGGDAWLWRSLGGEGFQSSRAFTAGAGLQPVAGDFDDNGVDDVFLYGPGNGPSSMFLGQPGGQFSPGPTWELGAGYQPTAADLNNDGMVDLFWQGLGATDDWAWWATGGGNFWGEVAWAVDGDVLPAVGDFEGDGYNDVLWVAPGGAAGQRWRGLGAGEFQVEPLVLPGEGRAVPISGDHDGDGRTDLYWHGADGRPDRLWLAR